MFHLFLFFHLSIGVLLRAQAGEEKTPLLVVCVASKQKEKNLSRRKEKNLSRRRKISAAFSSQQLELLKKQPTRTNHQIEKKRR